MAYNIWKDEEYIYCNVKYSKLNLSDEGEEGAGVTSSRINEMSLKCICWHIFMYVANKRSSF